jgi:PAS domain S-box-containing protein
LKRAFPSLFALLIGVLSLSITAMLWQHERRSERDGLRASFDFGLRQTASRIEQRMASYEQMLRGVQGFFMASDQIDRAAFDHYVDALLAGADFAGLQSITYGPLVPASRVADHVSAQRASGTAGYAVVPAGDRPLYAPVTYIAPDSEANARVLGYDLYSDAVRRAAMEQARDSGGAALTGKIRLFNDAGEAPRYAFLMVLPLYAKGHAVDTVARRRANLVGWVWAAFRATDLMSSLYGEGTPGLELRVHDGVTLSDDTLIFSTPTDAAAARPARFEAQEYIGLAGHTWTLLVRSLPEFEERHSHETARVILIAGIGLSALLAALTYLLATAQARAHGVARTITRELRGSEERYRRIVETADEGIWLVDPRGEITFANPKLLRMLGFAEAEMLGRRLGDFIDERDLAGFEQHHGQDIRLRRKDGSELWVSVSVATIVDAAGAPAGGLGMVTDITERKQSQSKRELLETQLRESQKMEAIGTLAGGIAHDFNNILAAILGNVALTRRHLAASHAAIDGLDQIERASVRARSLVQKILAFSRMQPHALVSQAMRPLVEESVVLLRSTLPSVVTLESKLTDAPLLVGADATNIQQILMNLCTNAWHAMQGSAGRIVIALDRVEIDGDAARLLGDIPAGAYAHLSVRDNGSGMTEATRLRVFEPFFTTKPVGEGTGLGLSVVHGIVIAHHGAISVESQPGRGSTFHVYFPLSQLPAVAVPEEVAMPEAPRGDGEHVMYVDDDPMMRVMIEGLLQNAGYRVTAFDRPRDALACVQAGSADFDLVVTDFNMPEMTGLDLAEQLAVLAPDLPVVISSGYLSDDMRKAALRAGVRGLLQKEYSLERLASLVHAVLSDTEAASKRSRA